MSNTGSDISSLAKTYAGFVKRGHLTAEEVIETAIRAERVQAANIAFQACSEKQHEKLGMEAFDAVMTGVMK